ncbi:TonB-dependent siderophore receptor [Caulobacter segnis]|uniref:TonB-dependent siderophore receptor n=2 Tax=Caulobacter segnis TaxID=88688 RepID=D5VDM4_CAUST|nr:TonB-dependent siderophore receptor [Caulobacter segnis]ADG08574.1 TonB-dependent siderophore receptor [Caulobacter segnis ATCC 21756]AVQ00425.1 TonB-dependent siderophore receptor [Caulobacter segnis]
MRNPTFAGVVSRPRRALGVAAVAGLAGLGLAQAASAAAMDAAAPIATAPAADSTEVSSVKIDAKRVTDPSSSKFTAPLLDTPRSVTVIPSAIIEQTAATSLQDILRTSPGITFGAGEGGQPLADRPFIRGQSSGNNVFVDGVRDTGGQTREVFNLEQVEVIKGPDSVYSGRGSGGGSINLSSKTPKAESFVGGSAAAGTDQYYRVTADGNYAFAKNAALRLNLMATGGDTPGRDSVSFKRWGVAPSLAFGIDTQTQATLSYYHLDTDQDPDYGIPLASKRTWGVAGTDSRTRPASGILDVSRDAYYGLERDWMKTKADIATIAVRHEINDDLAIRQVVRYGKTLNDYLVTNPGDGGAAQFVAGEWWMKRGTKSRWNETTTTAFVTDLTGKFELAGLKNRFNIGVELSREVNDNATYVIFTTAGSACPAGFTGAGTGDCTRLYAPNPGDAWTGVINRGPLSTSKTRNGSIYAFDTIDLTDKLLLNVGVRYDDYSTQGVNATATSANGVVTGVTYTSLPKASWDFVNYQIGLNYKPTPSSSLYVSYATSSTPPNIAGGDQNTAATPAQVVLDPEDTTSIEAGAKWNVFNDKLALSGAVFRTERKNAQIALSATEVAQAGEVRVQGVEIGVSGYVTRAWQVFGGYTYMDSELVKGPYTSVNVGDPLANTPKNTVSLFTTYRVLPQLSVGGGVYYVSKMFGGNQGGAGGGTNKVFAPSYTRYDAFASWTISKTASLQLNVQNLTDERYIARTNGVHHADPAPGRQALLTLNVKY